jgi:hypothetical protein
LFFACGLPVLVMGSTVAVRLRGRVSRG